MIDCDLYECRSEQLISKLANHQRRKAKTENQCPEKNKEAQRKRLKWIWMTDSRSRLILEGNHYKQIVLPDCKTLQMGQSKGKRNLPQRPPDIDGDLIFLFISHLIETLKNIKKNIRQNDSGNRDKREISCGLMSRTWSSPWGV